MKNLESTICGTRIDNLKIEVKTMKSFAIKPSVVVASCLMISQMFSVLPAYAEQADLSKVVVKVSENKSILKSTDLQKLRANNKQTGSDFSNSSSGRDLNSSVNSAAAPGGSGGGNVYKGRPLESYIIDPHSLSAYQKILLPLQSKLTAENGTLRFIQDWALQKTWYYLPGPLDTISSDKIGAAVQTGQGALQDFDAIWIDSEIFEKMTPEDQAKLILHEMLMSVKLLNFEGRENQCRAVRIGYDFGDHCNYTNVRRGQPSDLTPEDYQNIRETVIELLKLPAVTLPLGTVEDIMARGKFSFDSYGFRKLSTKQWLEKDELISMIRTSILTESWPTNYYDMADIIKQNPDVVDVGVIKPIEVKSSGHCEISLNIGSEYISGKVVVYPSGKAPITLNFNIPAFVKDVLGVHNTWVQGGKDVYPVLPDPYVNALQKIPLEQPFFRAIPGKLTLGDRNRTIRFGYNGSNLETFEIDEAVLTQNDEKGPGELWSGYKQKAFCGNRTQYIIKPFNR